MLINGKIVFFICQLSNIVFCGVDFAGFIVFFLSQKYFMYNLICYQREKIMRIQFFSINIMRSIILLINEWKIWNSQANYEELYKNDISVLCYECIAFKYPLFSSHSDRYFVSWGTSWFIIQIYFSTSSKLQEY